MPKIVKTPCTPRKHHLKSEFPSFFARKYPSKESASDYQAGGSPAVSIAETEDCIIEEVGLNDLSDLDKKGVVLYRLAGDFEGLKRYLDKLVAEHHTVQVGWCNLVLMATNEGEKAMDPDPEKRKGYVQISPLGENKVKVLLFLLVKLSIYNF